MFRRLISGLYVLVALTMPLVAQECAEELLLDGSERVIDFDADSTGHWWAITSPYTDMVRLWVDGVARGPYGHATTPVFSPNGMAWASLVVGADRTLRLLTEAGEQYVQGTSVSSIFYSVGGTVPWMVVHEAERALVTNGTRTFDVTGVLGQCSIDPSESVIWAACRRGALVSLVRNGVDVLQADEITIGGVWADGRVVAAVRYGMRWTLMLGDEELVTNVIAIRDLSVNQTGSVLACITSLPNGLDRVTMYTNEYIEPWYGPALDHVTDLTLNPWVPLVAYIGQLRGSRFVYYNASAYPAGLETGPPSFAHDGSTMVFMGRDDSEFITVEGRRHVVRQGIQTSSRVVIDPRSGKLAYSSAQQMILRDPEENEIYFARLCDRMGRTVYNSRTHSFVGLGTFGDRLFLITCRP